MARLIKVLSALLVLQIALAASLGLLAKKGGAFRSDEKLIDLELGSLDEIAIEEAGEPSLVMKQKDGAWVLPEHFGFPVSTDKLDRLTKTLFGVAKSWPVGATGVAAKRFKVADDDFERKIGFSKADGDGATVFIGTSPGFKKVHARVAGQKEIYAIEFSAYQASVEPKDWEAKDFLNLERDEIMRADLPDVSLIRSGDQLTVSDLGDEEEIDSEEFGTLVSKLSQPSFLEVMGTENKPEYRQDAPAFRYTIEMRSGELVDYTYSQPKEGGDFILKVSSKPDYFKVSQYSAKRLQELTRDKLVRHKEATESERGEEEAEDRGGSTAGEDLLSAAPAASSPPSTP